ncbi:MAG: YabP/YqfC family sporulation protein [Clostridiales bacterium]|nr:YabP/YqfC family sporulation protein [Candidatus Cacconaster stercorequi]
MPYESEHLSGLSHRLEMEGREHLTVTGVEDVERFDENCVVMSTCVGTLVVTGEELHIEKLSLDGGELHVDGRMDGITYEERHMERGNLLTRLFG